MKKYLRTLITTGIILSLGGIITGATYACVENNKNSKTPLEWCYLEVTTNYDNYWEEDFDLPYSYKEIFANYNLDSEWYSNHKVKSIYNYEITAYVADTEMIDVWYCGIAFNSKNKPKYHAKECVDIDCDWAYSVPIGKKLAVNED